jgi:CubicO group peptidase (beta-lactamase class C family)
MRQELFRKMSALLVILLFVVTIIIPAISGHTNNSILSDKQVISNNDQIFDKKINLLMKIAHIPSLSACIIKDKEIVWYKGYGFYNGENVPNIDTIYDVASVSKTVTATALMQLYDKGLFDLDDDINEYLPLKLRNPKYPEVPVTFRMLLAHQSSLSRGGNPQQYVKFNSSNKIIPLESWIVDELWPNGSENNLSIWNDYVPGKKFSYSNLGYCLVGYLVSRISNQSFHEYCMEHIFKPLNMRNTSFLLSDLNLENVAYNYVWTRVGFPRLFSGRGKGNYIPVARSSGGQVNPAGGLKTSCEDLSHFLIAHMNGGIYNGVRILNESTVELMHKVQYSKNLPNVQGAKYGLGWFVWERFGKEKYSGHGGDGIASHADMKYRISDKIGIIYFVNRALVGSDFTSFITRMFVLEKVLFKKANEFR